VFFTSANGIWLLTEVDIWISGTRPSDAARTVIIVELAEVAYASSMDNSTIPEAAAFDLERPEEFGMGCHI